MPGARKIELFARNYNIRPGWLSLGNQIGPYFGWNNIITCDGQCNSQIESGVGKRYKSRLVPNMDYCEDCFSKSDHIEQDFFVLNNTSSSLQFHQYYCCDGCHVEPIWGLRFSCENPELDLCEVCYDDRVGFDPALSRSFTAVETHVLAGGEPIHRLRCSGCLMEPVIGYVFFCTECSSVYMCEKCFFLQKTSRYHIPSHRMEMVMETTGISNIKCSNCQQLLKDVRFQCDSCLMFDLCENCMNNDILTFPLFPFHSSDHRFSKIVSSSDTLADDDSVQPVNTSIVSNSENSVPSSSTSDDSDTTPREPDFYPTEWSFDILKLQ